VTAQPGRDYEHDVLFRLLFGLQVAVVVHPCYLLLEVRLFVCVFGLLADDAIGAFEDAAAAFRSEDFQQLLDVDGLIEDLDDQVL
jgi:hypothetical protein